jgi:YD repeat-containing protein
MRTLFALLLLTTPATPATLFADDATTIRAADMARPTPCFVAELPDWLRSTKDLPIDWSPARPVMPIVPMNSCLPGYESTATGRCTPDCRQGSCRRIRVAGEQTIFRDAQGRTTGSVTPRGDGSFEYRDSSGRSLGRSTTDPSGQTRYWDERGRSLGTSTGPARAPFLER